LFPTKASIHLISSRGGTISYRSGEAATTTTTAAAGFNNNIIIAGTAALIQDAILQTKLAMAR
jgi:hypothetical protein